MTARLPMTVAVMAIVVATVSPTVGRIGQASGSAQQEPVFRIDANLVVLHVMVADKKGAPVTNLSSDAFRILEEGRPQAIHLFSSQDAPITVGLLIDSSGSMRATRDLVIAAAGAFVETSNPLDEVFALAFNDDIRLVLPPGTPFTSDADELKAALTRTITARGRTAFHDGVAAGLDYLTKGSHERKALVVISDGGDNASTATFDRILASAHRSNVLIYGVGLVDPLDRDANPKRLKQLAETSGGEAFFPSDARQVSDVLRHIARDLRYTYTMGYVPTNTTPDGRFHRIRVSVSTPDRRAVVVRTRSGYVAGRATDGSK